MFITLTKVQDIFQTDPVSIRINPSTISSLVEVKFARDLGTGSKLSVLGLGDILVIEPAEYIEEASK